MDFGLLVCLTLRVFFVAGKGNIVVSVGHTTSPVSPVSPTRQKNSCNFLHLPTPRLSGYKRAKKSQNV